MRTASRLDDLEHWAEHRLLRIWEVPELWVRRSPWLYALLALAAVCAGVIQ